MTFMRVAVVCLVACLTVPATAQDRPLPDFKTFLQEARKRLQPDETRQSSYMYVETRRERKLDASGQATRESVNVYESYPGLPGEPRWERVIVKDGVPITPAELAKQDRERQKKVMEYVRKREREPDRVRADEERKRAEEQRELDEAVDDALRIFDMRMLGRENIGGHDTIVISFTPRPGTAARSRTGKILRHFAGKAWVSEREYELVRVEGEALDTVSFGLGLFARVHKGSNARFERRKVNGEEWLPASASYTASARLFLLRRLRVGGVSEYADYRKFTVSTETHVAQPK
jgi:hypothetical protein